MLGNLENKGIAMDRTLCSINIEAVKIEPNKILIRARDNNYKVDGLHYAMQKEWDFLEDILESFTGKEDTVNAILRIAKEYKGYDG